MAADLKTSVLRVLVLVVVCFSNAHSKGSPWDWQSMNAKYPEQQRQQPSGNHLYPRSKGDPVTLQVNANVTVHEGDIARLPCRIRQLGEFTVSWLRGRDTSVLSVGHHTFSSDQRFSVVQVPRPRIDAADWNLEIKTVTQKDGGWYDCQVNTEPKINNKSYLKVIERPLTGLSNVSSTDGSLQDSPAVEQRQVIPQIQEFLQPMTSPRTSISGPAVLRRVPGDTLTLECTVSRLSSPPSSLYWTHNDRAMTPKSDPGISIKSEKLAGMSHSRLVVVSLASQNEGTYSCITDVSSPAYVELIIDGLPPKAMAQVGKDAVGGVDEVVSMAEIVAFQQDVGARLKDLELKFAELQVNLLGDWDGAEALASRVSSSTVPVSSTVLAVSVVLSLHLACDIT